MQHFKLTRITYMLYKGFAKNCEIKCMRNSWGYKKAEFLGREIKGVYSIYEFATHVKHGDENVL